jgi:ribonuclease HI
MIDPIRIWTSATYQQVYRCGGWAAVRVCQGQVTGVAGGERNTTAYRMALSGLVAALRDLPSVTERTPASPIAIQTTSPELAEFAGVLAVLGQATQAPAPSEDLDLWAQIFTAAKGHRLSLVRTPHKPGAPTAFAAAWADLALDKAKATGRFTAAIPKANLAKISGLDLR